MTDDPDDDPVPGDPLPPDDEDDSDDENEATDGPAAEYEAPPDAPHAPPYAHGWEKNG